MNRYFEVNVNFMLCPSDGMTRSFEILPPWMLWPSYRTFIVIVLFFLSFPICYIYICICTIIIAVIEGVKKSIGKSSDRLASDSSIIDNRYSIDDRKKIWCSALMGEKTNCSLETWLFQLLINLWVDWNFFFFHLMDFKSQENHFSSSWRPSYILLIGKLQKCVPIAIQRNK